MSTDNLSLAFRMNDAQAEIADLIDFLADDLHAISSWTDDAELSVWCSLVDFAEGTLGADELGGMAVQDLDASLAALRRLLELVHREGGFWRGRAHLVRQLKTDLTEVPVGIEPSGYDEMPRWEWIAVMEFLTERRLPDSHHGPGLLGTTR